MRVLAVVALLVLVVELVVGFAFFAGYRWLGGWQPAVLLSAGVLLLMALKWMGSLDLHYDSEAGRVSIRVTWWGAVVLTTKPEREVEVRILGIPWRRRLKAKVPAEAELEEAERERRREQKHRAMRESAAHWPEMIPALPAGLQLLSDLLCEAREIEVKVRAPTQNELADGIIAGVVGHRGVGPLDLQCSGKGERRVQVHYRIGLLRAALCALYAGIQAGPSMLRARGRRKERAQGEQEQEQNTETRGEPKESE
jgi:hypothetical protein